MKPKQLSAEETKWETESTEKINRLTQDIANLNKQRNSEEELSRKQEQEIGDWDSITGIDATLTNDLDFKNLDASTLTQNPNEKKQEEINKQIINAQVLGEESTFLLKSEKTFEAYIQELFRIQNSMFWYLDLVLYFTFQHIFQNLS